MRVVDFVKKTEIKSDTENVNRKKILDISKTFHKKCGIPSVEKSDSILVESGHQPNFLPHTGVWKKIFLMNKLSDNSIFGFADYNLSTASLLYQNKICDHTGEGYSKFGFKIKSKDRWMRFDKLQKPDKEDVEKLAEKTHSIFLKNSKRGEKPNMNQLIQILMKSSQYLKKAIM